MKYWALSILIHLCLVLGLLIHGHKSGPNTGNSKEKPKGFSGKAGQILPKTIEIEVITKPKTENKGPGDKSKPSKTCKSSYGGIGIMDNFATGLIELVAPGYPADRAGILVGDKVLKVMSDEGSDIRGTVGTSVTLIILRQSINKVFSVTMIREKICTEDAI